MGASGLWGILFCDNLLTRFGGDSISKDAYNMSITVLCVQVTPDAAFLIWSIVQGTALIIVYEWSDFIKGQ